MGVKEMWMSHRCVYSVCGQGMCSCRHCISLPPAKRKCLLIRLWAQRQRKVLLYRLEGKFWPFSKKHTYLSSYWVQAGGNGEVLLSRERKKTNYDISTELYRQKLNICSEASRNIIQARRDSAVICCPCVPSGSEEERQTTCSYHSSVQKVQHTKAVFMESTVPLLF